MINRSRKERKAERRQAREAQGFGRHIPWAPDALPTAALEYWPRKEDWPTAADIHRFIETTEGKPDVRLAVLSGLRRWSEPASSQLLAALASIVVSIVAIAIAIAASSFNLPFYIGMVGAGVVYILVVLAGLGLAFGMDKRRKMAHVWLRAIEDGLAAANTQATATKWTWLRYQIRRRLPLQTP